MTNPSNVPIVGILSFSLLKSKSSLPLRAMPTIPNAAQIAVRQGKRSATEVVTTDPSVKCFLRYAPSAVRTQKYPSSHKKIDQYIVAIATARSD